MGSFEYKNMTWCALVYSRNSLERVLSIDRSNITRITSLVIDLQKVFIFHFTSKAGYDKFVSEMNNGAEMTTVGCFDTVTFNTKVESFSTIREFLNRTEEELLEA